MWAATANYSYGTPVGYLVAGSEAVADWGFVVLWLVVELMSLCPRSTDISRFSCLSEAELARLGDSFSLDAHPPSTSLPPSSSFSLGWLWRVPKEWQPDGEGMCFSCPNLDDDGDKALKWIVQTQQVKSAIMVQAGSVWCRIDSSARVCFSPCNLWLVCQVEFLYVVVVSGHLTNTGSLRTLRNSAQFKGNKVWNNPPSPHSLEKKMLQEVLRWNKTCNKAATVLHTLFVVLYENLDK